MATDHTLALRRAMVLAAKGSLSIGGVVADRVYGPNVPADPTWPFIRFEPPILTPTEASGWEGGSYRCTGHVFTKGADESQCARGAAALAKTFDQARLLLGTGVETIELFHVQTQIIRDSDEATGWHAIVGFDVTVAEAA